MPELKMPEFKELELTVSELKILELKDYQSLLGGPYFPRTSKAYKNSPCRMYSRSPQTTG